MNEVMTELSLNDYFISGCQFQKKKFFFNTSPYFFRLFMPLFQLNNVANEFTKTPIKFTLSTVLMGIYQNDQEKLMSI